MAIGLHKSTYVFRTVDDAKQFAARARTSPYAESEPEHDETLPRIVRVQTYGTGGRKLRKVAKELGYVGDSALATRLLSKHRSADLASDPSEASGPSQEVASQPEEQHPANQSPLVGIGPEGVDETDSPSLDPMLEGEIQRVYVNAYERNRGARADCLAHWGHECQICGSNFTELYGDLAVAVIHVHHRTPLSEGGGVKRRVDPKHDLVPVCANCHAVIHYNGQCRSLDDVKKLRV